MAGPTLVAFLPKLPDLVSGGPVYDAPSITFAVPAACQPGDGIILAIYTSVSGGLELVAPSGFNRQIHPAGIWVPTTYAGILQQGMTTIKLSTFDNAARIRGGLLLAARGVDPVQPFAVGGPGRMPVGSNPFIVGGPIVMPRANCLAVQVVFEGVAPQYQSQWTPSAGFTEMYDGVIGPYFVSEASWKSFPAAGNTDAFQTSFSGAVGTGARQLVAVAFQSPPPPTIETISPIAGPLSGGTSVVIKGTLFPANATVEFDGVSATEVTYISSTEIRCATPAGAAGPADVTVSTPSGSATLADGYTYISVADHSVRVVKGGLAVGTDKALPEQWPAQSEWIPYGGRDDLWGQTWTPAEVNSGFGAAVAAVVGPAAEAFIDAMRVTVFYGVPGVVDPQTYVSVLHVDPDRQTHRTLIRQLPRSGYTVLTDPAIDRRVSGASFFSSRIDEPGRNIEKLWTTWEQTIDLSPQGLSAAGLQIWARVDEGAPFQLRDGAGDPLTVRTSGFHRWWFPPTDVARGKYVQLEWRVPALVGSQVATAVAVDAGVLRAYYRPENAEESSMTLILHKFTKQEAYEDRRTPYARLRTLLALRDPGRPPIEVRDAFGRTQRVVVTGVRARELTFRGDDTPSLVAYVDYDVVDYS